MLIYTTVGPEGFPIQLSTIKTNGTDQQLLTSQSLNALTAFLSSDQQYAAIQPFGADVKKNNIIIRTLKNNQETLVADSPSDTFTLIGGWIVY